MKNENKNLKPVDSAIQQETSKNDTPTMPSENKIFSTLASHQKWEQILTGTELLQDKYWIAKQG
jgi:hypothetical protein